MTSLPVVFSTLVLTNLFTLTTCDQINLKYQVREEQKVGTVIGNVRTDAKLDQAYNLSVISQFQYSFLSRPAKAGRIFTIEARSGSLKIASRLDRDRLCEGAKECPLKYDVAVMPRKYFQIIRLVISVQDINDNVPHFLRAEFRYKILESAPPGHQIALPEAIDRDSRHLGIRRYTLEPESDAFKLQVKNSEGGTMAVSIVLAMRLDRELVSFYQFTLKAYDGGEPPKSGTALINITVIDVNDNSPVFQKPLFDVTLPENISVGSTVAQVIATDKDSGLYGEVMYGFTPATALLDGKTFAIDNRTGELILQTPLDFETKTSYTLTVVAYDMGQDSLPARATVTIEVTDVNDNKPMIRVNTITDTPDAYIQESSPIGTFVAHVDVTDRDQGLSGQYACTVDQDSFMLEPLDGGSYKILTAGALDRETTEAYYINIMCDDRGDPPMHSIKEIKIKVKDTNDNKPKFTQDTYHFQIQENNIVNAVVGRLNATDEDEGTNGQVYYHLVNNHNNELLSVNRRTGMVTAHKILDRENNQEIRVTVVAIDKGEPPLSSTATVIVQVTDVNDFIPRFTDHKYSFHIQENKPLGARVGLVTAEDLDIAPFNTVTYELYGGRDASGIFSISASTGVITANQPLDREVREFYHLTVMAKNEGYIGMSSTCKVTVTVDDVNDNQPVFSYPTAYNNTVHISNQIQRGHVFARAHAFDKDKGRNSLIVFSLENTPPNDYFDIDPLNGAIKTRKSLAKIGSSFVSLTVRARDRGQPSMMAQQGLNIAINNSVILPVEPLGNMAPFDGFLSPHNMTILVSVASVSAFIALILVLVIVIIRRQGQIEDKKRYVTRTEGLRMLSTRDDIHDGTAGSESGSSDGVREATTPPCTRAAVFYSLDQLHQPWSNSELVLAKSDAQVSWPANLNRRGPQVEPRGPLTLENEMDTWSGELSATDSGRGTSEEGEPQHFIKSPDDRSGMDHGKSPYRGHPMPPPSHAKHKRPHGENTIQIQTGNIPSYCKSSHRYDSVRNTLVGHRLRDSLGSAIEEDSEESEYNAASVESLNSQIQCIEKQEREAHGKNVWADADENELPPDFPPPPMELNTMTRIPIHVHIEHEPRTDTDV